MKANIFSHGNKRKINPDWFTGPVQMTDLSSTIQSKGHDIYHVYFKNNSRTKLHSHNGDQILIAVSGSGSMDVFKKLKGTKTHFSMKKVSSTRLNPGDMVFIPKGTLHTHGSISKKTFSHIAINVISKGSKKYDTDWFESDLAKLATGLV